MKMLHLQKVLLNFRKKGNLLNTLDLSQRTLKNGQNCCINSGRLQQSILQWLQPQVKKCGVSETKNRSLTRVHTHCNLYTLYKNQIVTRIYIHWCLALIKSHFGKNTSHHFPNEQHVCLISLHFALVLLYRYFRVVRMWHHFTTQSVC